MREPFQNVCVRTQTFLGGPQARLLFGLGLRLPWASAATQGEHVTFSKYMHRSR